MLWKRSPKRQILRRFRISVDINRKLRVLELSSKNRIFCYLGAFEGHSAIKKTITNFCMRFAGYGILVVLQSFYALKRKPEAGIKSSQSHAANYPVWSDQEFDAFVGLNLSQSVSCYAVSCMWLVMYVAHRYWSNLAGVQIRVLLRSRYMCGVNRRPCRVAEEATRAKDESRNGNCACCYSGKRWYYQKGKMIVIWSTFD